MRKSAETFNLNKIFITCKAAKLKEILPFPKVFTTLKTYASKVKFAEYENGLNPCMFCRSGDALQIVNYNHNEWSLRPKDQRSVYHSTKVYTHFPALVNCKFLLDDRYTTRRNI
jgi:hypothetical protein